MKKAPDKYRCIKVPLHSILHKDDNAINIFNTIQDAVYRTNYITTKTNLLLRLWCLEKYHQNIDIPIIDENTIRMCMKSLLLPSSGPKPKNNNLLLFNEFKALHNFELEDGKNLSSVFDYYAITILTSIENNIKLHFFDYVNRFINSYFKHINKDNLNDKEFKKQLFKELHSVKSDILNGTLKSDEKYHNWINEYHYKIVPQEYDKSYHYDVKCHPQKYIKHMIFMNCELEKIGGKMYQFFPLQTAITPNHIQIDTKSVIELLVDKDKKKYIDNVLLYKEILWDKYFTINPKIKNYQFDNTIITDGYAAALRFIHKDYIEGELLKKEKMKQARQNAKNKDTIKMNKSATKAKDNSISSKEEVIDFPYIDEVDKIELEGKHIFIDPGKRTLFTMMNDEGKFLSYTNKQRVSETKRLVYQNKLKKYKEHLGITEKENELSSYNSKSCNLDNYRAFIDKKISINKDIYKLYQNKKFRQYKWYAFINKKRTEDNMLNKIEKAYGKDSIVIIGDWCIEKQMKNFISTPNIGLKRKLKERFKVYNIDEYRTSCLNYKTEEPCNNLYLPDKNNKTRKIHSILTYKMEKNRLGCINRDKNGCKNIQKIFEYYIKNNTRPENYRRGQAIQKLQTASELSNCS
jgi:hypothetical protein